ncbi:MAG: hypothetical protein RLZZ127_692 [Planctomycetota bacterium]|jgi:HD-like signal output (HDOD) protein
MPDDLFARFRGATPVEKDGSSGSRPVAVALGEAEVLAAVDRVPSLPTVVTQILAMVGKSQSSAAELESLIRQDMALAGRLLKLVNSPFYGLAQPVASISQAVSIIGFASLKSLVLAASTSALLQNDLSSYGFAERGLWKSSVANAALARAIAQRNRTHRDQVEEYFVAAFLKDIGILVLGPLAARSGVRLRRPEKADEDLQRRERKLLGFDHCWAGLKVAERWNLPEQIREAIAHHHRMPADLPPERVRRLASVRLAERITANAGIGLAPDHPFETAIDPVLLVGSGLDQTAFQDLIAQVPRIIASAEMPV